MTKTVYVFDAYGTLFDVHAAVRRHADAVGENHARISEIWRSKQLEYTWTRSLMDRYVDFWELTQQALDFALASGGVDDANVRTALLEAYWSLDCFPEVPEILERLKKNGHRLAILSNGSSDMLQSAVTSAGLEALIDKSISVDRIGIFKARREVYQMVLDGFQITSGDVQFQSSNRWDIAGARAFGFRTNWINRSGQPDEYADLPPDRVLGDLRGLLETL